jgi:hypothetical protein
MSSAAWRDRQRGDGASALQAERYSVFIMARPLQLNRIDHIDGRRTPMFGLNIVDHVRLNLTRAGENYAVHARAAERLSRRTLGIRIGVLALLLVAAAAAIGSLVTGGRLYQIATVVAASLAYVASGLEGRVHAHRVCAHSLWMVCERYRALLAETRDGLLDSETILRRRDELAAETHAAYGQTFPLDQPAFEDLRQSGDDEAGQILAEGHAAPAGAAS